MDVGLAHDPGPCLWGDPKRHQDPSQPFEQQKPREKPVGAESRLLELDVENFLGPRAQETRRFLRLCLIRHKVCPSFNRSDEELRKEQPKTGVLTKWPL